MKKLFLVFAAIAITASAFAQNDPTNKKMDQQNNTIIQNQNMQNHPYDKTNGVVMQNGKMMQVKNGQRTLIERDFTISNGYKIMSDGSYTKKDGSKVTLKEGQHMDMWGNMETDKDKNTYQVTDTTRLKIR